MKSQIINSRLSFYLHVLKYTSHCIKPCLLAWYCWFEENGNWSNILLSIFVTSKAYSKIWIPYANQPHPTPPYSPLQTSKHRILSQVNKAEPVEDTKTDTHLINVHLYNYQARQEGMTNPLTLLRAHKIVLCISIENKRFLNATILMKQQINGVKSWNHSRDQLLFPPMKQRLSLFFFGCVKTK